MESKRQARIISGHPFRQIVEEQRKVGSLVELQVWSNAAQPIRRPVPAGAFVDQLSKIPRYAAGEEGDLSHQKAVTLNRIARKGKISGRGKRRYSLQQNQAAGI